MLERIRAIWSESTWLLTEIIGFDFDIEVTLSRLEAALDDLEATIDPTDDQVEIVFKELASLQGKLSGVIARMPKHHQPLLENMTDRIEIFLFHHRIF